MSNSIFEFNVETVVSINKRIPAEVNYYVWSDRKVVIKKYLRLGKFHEIQHQNKRS